MKSIRMVMVVLAIVLAAVPAVARNQAVLLAAIEAGDAGTVAMELSLGAELPAGMSVSSAVLPEVMRLMPLAAIGSASTAIAQPPAGVVRLIAAMRNGDARAVQIEIANGTDPRSVMMMEAYLSPAIAEALSQTGVTRVLASAVDTRLDTPLMAAARCGNCKELVSLLAAGADPLAVHPTSGLRASDIAAAAGNREAQAILVAYSTNLGLIFTR